MRQLLEKKGIKSLYHFTNATNLNNIFQYGLVTRSDLENISIPFAYNDEYRHDHCLNALSLSIEFPNYKMFYSLRCRHPDYNWAVLEIDANILVEFNCAYSWTNAADATISSIPVEERKGREAFLELFQDRTGYPRRERLNIPECYPTNPQAEVLVFSKIPTQYIKNVLFNDDTMTECYRSIMPDTFFFKTDSNKFEPRKDYLYWQ